LSVYHPPYLRTATSAGRRRSLMPDRTVDTQSGRD